MSKFIAYAPLARTVSNASLLVVPEVESQEAITAWAAGVVTAVGDKIKYNGNAYYCISAGTTTAASQPTATDGDDTTDAAVTWRYIRPVRNNLILVNDSSEVMYLGFGNAAVANRGIRLNANGGSFNAMEELRYCPQCDIYAIAAASGSNNLCIQEA